MGEPVQIRRVDVREARSADGFEALIVCKKHQDVRLGRAEGNQPGGQEEGEQGEEEFHGRQVGRWKVRAGESG